MENMILEKKADLDLRHEFDSDRCRHSLMGFQSVLHCHHYMTLTTQMADFALGYLQSSAGGTLE